MTDGEAAALIRSWEFRRQNAAAEHLKGAWYRREYELSGVTGQPLACGCLIYAEGDYVSAYEFAKDR